ncbi:MAG: MTH1187 family thiamine-binding protein [Candidatus Scalindua sediminis]|nr:MTH1187 family thiamine-binding protein [Candidatus Scalindua sediminis]HDY68281.1 MTH1187 family thiamine-binding protein [Candidatus Scalindua sp.]
MIANFSIVPIGKENSLSTQVAEVLKIVDESGINYKLHSMGTILEGDWDKILRLIRKCHKRMLENSDRVLTTITIDDRKGKSGRIVGKVKSVERKLGKELKK